MVSSGISKFIAILLAILDSRDGAVFIDEIENGMYYKVLAKMSKNLLEQATAVGCQIFASTHSMEFLQLISPLIEENPNDFSIIRVEGNESGSHATLYSGKNLSMALSQKVDVR